MAEAGRRATPKLVGTCERRRELAEHAEKYLVLRILVGALVAIILALVPIVAELTGLAAWKIVLAAIGLVLFVLGSKGRDRRSRPLS